MKHSIETSCIRQVKPAASSIIAATAREDHRKQNMKNINKIKLKRRGDGFITLIAPAARSSEAQPTERGRLLREFTDRTKKAPSGISRSQEMPGEGVAQGLCMHNPITSLLLKTLESTRTPRARWLTGNRSYRAAFFTFVSCQYHAFTKLDIVAHYKTDENVTMRFPAERGHRREKPNSFAAHFGVELQRRRNLIAGGGK